MLMSPSWCHGGSFFFSIPEVCLGDDVMKPCTGALLIHDDNNATNSRSINRALLSERLSNDTCLAAVRGAVCPSPASPCHNKPDTCR